MQIEWKIENQIIVHVFLNLSSSGLGLLSLISFGFTLLLYFGSREEWTNERRNENKNEFVREKNNHVPPSESKSTFNSQRLSSFGWDSMAESFNLLETTFCHHFTFFLFYLFESWISCPIAHAHGISWKEIFCWQKSWKSFFESEKWKSQNHKSELELHESQTYRRMRYDVESFL